MAHDTTILDAPEPSVLDRPRVKSERSRLPLILLLILLGAFAVALPLAKWVLPVVLSVGTPPIDYPGVQWVHIDPFPDRYGNWRLDAAVRFDSEDVSTDRAVALLDELVARTGKKYHYYHVRVYDRDDRCDCQMWSDNSGMHFNVKPGDDNIPLDGPINVPGIHWLAIGTLPPARPGKPDFVATVRFDDRVINIPDVEYFLWRVIQSTRGQYAAYTLFAQNARGQHVTDTWADATGKHFRTVPSKDYTKQ